MDASSFSPIWRDPFWWADHRPTPFIGTTGSDAEFIFPFLNNSQVVCSAWDIAKIESGLKKRLSCAYLYRPDMTPRVLEGEGYDGLMRDVSGSHVSVVDTGLTGTDVTI